MIKDSAGMDTVMEVVTMASQKEKKIILYTISNSMINNMTSSLDGKHMLYIEESFHCNTVTVNACCFSSIGLEH